MDVKGLLGANVSLITCQWKDDCKAIGVTWLDAHNQYASILFNWHTGILVTDRDIVIQGGRHVICPNVIYMATYQLDINNLNSFKLRVLTLLSTGIDTIHTPEELVRLLDIPSIGDKTILIDRRKLDFDALGNTIATLVEDTAAIGVNQKDELLRQYGDVSLDPYAWLRLKLERKSTDTSYGKYLSLPDGMTIESMPEETLIASIKRVESAYLSDSRLQPILLHLTKELERRKLIVLSEVCRGF